MVLRDLLNYILTLECTFPNNAAHLINPFKMQTKLRFFFIFIIFCFFSFLFGLSLSKQSLIERPILKKYQIQISNLSDILPIIYHLMRNYTGVAGLYVPLKKTINEEKFNVPGLYSYLTTDGWVILDKNDSSEIIIPIEWEKLKNLYYKHCERKLCINSKFAAAPINPLKVGENIIFHLGFVLFKYNLKNKEFTAFKGQYHHSIEPFQDSLIYVCSYVDNTLYMKNDAISLININTSKVVYKKSIPNILKKNLYGLLLGTNSITSINQDLIHVNDIQPVRQNTNFAVVGDLLLSLRSLSTVILYRPKTDSILWYSIGPWLNQHDVDILNDDMIGIYNNNVIRGVGFPEKTFSNISTYNFKTKIYGFIHHEVFRNLKIRSLNGSRFEILHNGNMFVEDSPGGMYYLISKEGNLISSKNFPYDKKNSVVGNWARPYNTKNY